jgi:hypothetical protein
MIAQATPCSDCHVNFEMRRGFCSDAGHCLLTFHVPSHCCFLDAVAKISEVPANCGLQNRGLGSGPTSTASGGRRAKQPVPADW